MPTLPATGKTGSREIPRLVINPDDVRRLAAKGLCVVEIAAALGCVRWAISKIKKRDGIAVLPALPQEREPSAFWLENDDRLRTLIEGGCSYKEAAAALGVSKNAAIGRAHRLGRMQRRAAVVMRPPKPKVEFPPTGHCLWPHGHPGNSDFHWCGEPAEIGHSYCATHHRRAYVKKRQAAEAQANS